MTWNVSCQGENVVTLLLRSGGFFIFLLLEAVDQKCLPVLPKHCCEM
uniref:Alternative protein RPIA n=1 Tax=Homo sapiens TaxID=9606 RepID=L0R8E0_HUMAN|nr:alternative protein RPIA [Homo sapiens]